MARKNPAAVELGRRGGKAKSAAKSATARVRGSAWGPRLIGAWTQAMARAADLLLEYRTLNEARLSQPEKDALLILAEGIRREPAPKK